MYWQRSRTEIPTNMDLVWLITGFVGVVLVVIMPFMVRVLPRMKRRKRPNLVKRTAEECGLVFQGEEHPFSRMARAFLLSAGSVKNVLLGSWKEGKVFIFDWELLGSDGLKQTGAAFQCETNLPTFELLFKTRISRLQFYSEELVFGGHSTLSRRKLIVFDLNREFSRGYLVIGSEADEPTIRAVFHPRLLEFLAQQDKVKKWCLKSFDSWLLVYCKNPDFGSRKWFDLDMPDDKLLSPTDLRAFLEHSTRIAERFVEQPWHI